MKKKGFLGLAAVTAVGMLLAGCGNSNSSGSEAAAAAEQKAGAEEKKETEAASTVEDKTADTAKTDTDWPKKDITIVVPFNAGGDTDFHARNLASYAAKILGVNVVVENVAGANGSAGMLQVMDSDPDGYTALFFHESMLTNKLVGTCDFNYTDMAPCAATIVDNSYVMAVNSKTGMTALEDVVAKAKENPGKLLYASSVGGYSYYVGRKFEEAFDVDFNIVDAGGGTDRNAALLAGTIDTNLNPYGVMKSYFDSGDFTAVACLGEERNPLFPDVPTAKEQGYDWTAERYYFLSFPEGTDPAIIEKMSKVVEQVCEDEEFIKATEDGYCVTPTYVGTEELVEHLDTAFADFSSHMELINN